LLIYSIFCEFLSQIVDKPFGHEFLFAVEKNQHT